jgi:hypothetical protein
VNDAPVVNKGDAIYHIGKAIDSPIITPSLTEKVDENEEDESKTS